MSNNDSLKAVVDTNILISSVLSTLGLPYQFVRCFAHDVFTLLISREMRAELDRVIRRPRFEAKFGLTTQTRDDLLLLVDTKAIVVAPAPVLPVSVRDAKDNIVLATALGGGADYLVTGDLDLLELHGDPRLGSLQVVTVRAFLAVLDVQS